MAAKVNLAELVEQVPATDREIQAQEQEAKAAAEAAKNGQPTPAKPPPKPDRWGAASKFTGPDPDVADKLCEQVLAGGRASIVELIALIRDPAAEDFKNYKPEYLLHCLALYVGRPDQTARRRMFVDALVAQVGDTRLSLHTRGFLARELQWIGDRRAVAALGKLLGEEQLCDDAARTLVAIGDGAAEQFRAALPGAKGRRRLVIVQALGALRDAPSLAALQKALGDEEGDVRIAAAWGLARVGAASSVDALLKAASTDAPWERVKTTSACLLLAENLAANGRKQEAARIYSHLSATRTDPKERYVRDAAAKALAALGVA
jgi:HEAT repeat protein